MIILTVEWTVNDVLTSINYTLMSLVGPHMGTVSSRRYLSMIFIGLYRFPQFDPANISPLLFAVFKCMLFYYHPCHVVYFGAQELDNAIKEMDGRTIEGPERGPMFKIQVQTANFSFFVLSFLKHK